MTFELVPNLSEGRDPAIVDACVAAVEATGARVVHRTSDAAHHRSVLTILGDGDALIDAAVALAEVTTARIDLREHRGVHPRIGALDVLPFVPLGEATLAETAALAHRAAERIWERVRVPSYYYGAASASGRTLPAVRRAGFEGLAGRPDPPDVGAAGGHPSAGAIAVGARPILIAFNVELATGDLAVAREIARIVRERDGGLRTLRALGLRTGPEVVQVSLNVTMYHATPLYRVVETVRALAAERGVTVLGGELIGCLPLDAVVATADYYLGIARPLPDPQ
ncbi:MAG TPA: glutamate formimidoyltransferase [Candidatus Baltobacteraceae bacterium]